MGIPTGEQTEDNERMLRWFIYPSFIINFIILIVVPEYRVAGAIYFIMAVFVMVAFSLKRFQDNVIGLRFSTRGVIMGIIAGISFVVINKAIPSFALGLPSLPLSLAQDIQAFIIIGIAPPLEEAWRSGIIGQMIDIYGVSAVKANIIQSPIFGILHLLAYGIALGAYSTWIALYGGVVAISGLLTAAIVAGLFFGWLMLKFRNVLPAVIGHSIINAFLFTAGYVVVF